MSIGIKDQYIFKFSINDNKDFIQDQDLDKFEIIEETGNVLPTFSLDFMSADPTILRSLNEGSDLEISFGKNENNLKTTKLNITKCRFTKSGDNKRVINLRGIVSNAPFNNTPRLQVTDKKSGVEVILDTARRNFGKVETNINTSNDSQNWVQYNISDKMFINDVWMHSWLPTSFLGIGITMEGTFILRDIYKYIREYQLKTKDFERYKYRFGGEKVHDNDLPYNGEYVVDVESGFINYWQGYKRNKLVHVLEDGTDYLISEDIKPVLALTNKLARKSEIESRFSNIGYQNDNVHSNYWSASLRNLSSLALFSSVKLELSFDNVVDDLQLLDLVMFQEPEVNDKKLSGDTVSGLYLVSKIGKTVSSGTLVTTALLCRESLNQPKGNLV